MLKILFVILLGVLVVNRERSLYTKMSYFELLQEFQPMQVIETILATESIPALGAIVAPKPIPAPTPITAPEPIPEREEISAPQEIPAPEPIPGLEPIPESEEFPAPGTLPASEVNGALQPTQDSETFLVGNTEALKKTEYALSLAFQRTRLSDHKENDWIILGTLVLSLVTILICLTVYRRLIRLSYRQDESKQIPSQLSMFLHGWECVMLELRAALERMQEFEKLHAHLQNELDSLKLSVKGQDNMLINLLSELESLKMIVKAKYEMNIQLLSVLGRTVEVDDEHDAHSHNESHLASIIQEDKEGPAKFQHEGDSLRKVEQEDGRPAHFQNEVDSVSNWKMRAKERRLRFQEIMDIMSVKREEDDYVDENVVYSQDEVDLLRTTEEEAEHYD
jgi:hypothetical protein